MSRPELQRERPETCLSDLALERFAIGEVTAPAERVALRSHLESCPVCRQRSDELAAAPAQQPDPTWWSANQPRRPSGRAGAQAPTGGQALTGGHRLAGRRRLAGGLVATAALAAVVAIVARPRTVERTGEQTSPPSETRAKGDGFVLELVARRSDGRTLPVFDGTALRAGDAVRFVVTAPEAGAIAVVGLDAAGHASVYAPAVAGAAGTRALPGSVVLDDSAGDERFVALLCPTPPAPEALTAAAARALAQAGGQPSRAPRLELPCRQTGLTIRKEARR